MKSAPDGARDSLGASPGVRGVSTERNAAFLSMSSCAMQIIKWLAAQAAADGAKGALALHH